MTNEVKRQHYVPQTYIKHFGVERNGNYFVKAVPKDAAVADKIFESSTGNICLMTDLYTLPGDTEEQRMLIERFYSTNYEEKYNRVHELLLDPDKRETTNDERELIISTVVTMFYRTTKWINMHNEFMNRILERGYDLAKEVGKYSMSFDGTEISFKGKSLKELQSELRTENRPGYVLTQLQVALKLIQHRIHSDGIQIGSLTDDDTEFITSDNPVSFYRDDDQRPMPFDPSNYMELPLDNKHILRLMPNMRGNAQETANMISRVAYSRGMGRLQCMGANFRQLNNAERFLIGSDNGLKLFLEQKDGVPNLD
jgi:Protein of unknown function (DUF4238)